MARKNNLNPINQDLIISRLKFENPWWITGEIDPEYASMNPRLYFELFRPLAEERDIRRALVLMGPRRVGKTVMMHHTIQNLISQGVDPQQICFIGIDNPLYLYRGLEELFQLSLQATGNSDPRDYYVFFDEIQYLKNWEVHLKVLVDSYPHTKFIASGSAAAALKLRSNESGAGRFTEFLLPPLTFHEYLHLKKLDGLIKPKKINWGNTEVDFFTCINYPELNRHFLDYLNFGGYPEVIFSEKIRANPSRYIKGDIVDKVLLRDLPSLYGIQDVQELNAFFTTLAYYSGNELSLETLSSTSGVGKIQLKKYLEYLEAAFLIRVVNRLDVNAKKFQRASTFKVFLTNPSIRSALFSPMEWTDDHLGNMVETGILAQWLHREWFTPWYARWSAGRQKGEVDLVGLDSGNFKPRWALEIKWSNRQLENPKALKGLIEFCKQNQLTEALVTSLDRESELTVEGIRLLVIPSAIYAYSVGWNTIAQKGKNSWV